MPKKNCYDTAIDILSRRDNAVREMHDKLKKKGFEPVDINETIDRLLSKNFLNDRHFACGRARYRATISGWGKTRIEQELIQKGVDNEAISNALSELTDEEYENHNFKKSAQSILQQRFKPLSEQFPSLDSSELKASHHKEIQRRTAFLLRRGFSLEESTQALRAAEEDFNKNIST